MAPTASTIRSDRCPMAGEIATVPTSTGTYAANAIPRAACAPVSRPTVCSAPAASVAEIIRSTPTETARRLRVSSANSGKNMVLLDY